MLWQRRSDYVERREDGYQEPQRVFIVATAHVSSQSASDVMQAIQVGCTSACVCLCVCVNVSEDVMQAVQVGCTCVHERVCMCERE